MSPNSAAAATSGSEASTKPTRGRDRKVVIIFSVIRSTSTFTVREMPYLLSPKRRAWCRTGSSVIRAPTLADRAGMNRCCSAYSEIRSSRSRRYALSEQPLSVIGTPVRRRMSRLATQDGTFRSSSLSCRCWRQPQTRSYPSSSLATSIGMSRGSFCRSPSSDTMTLPRA